MSEQLNYAADTRNGGISNSYTGESFYDSTIGCTKFTPKWTHGSAKCDPRDLTVQASHISRELKLDSIATENLMSSLRHNGYLDAENRVIREFQPGATSDLASAHSLIVPHSSQSYRLARLLNEYPCTVDYGHAYSYGAHMEMTKAKYFVGQTPKHPFNDYTLHEMFSNMISLVDSRNISILLERGLFIFFDMQVLQDGGSYTKNFYKVSPTSWINLDGLKQTLGGFSGYLLLTARLIQVCLSERKQLTRNDLVTCFLAWQDVNENTVEDTIKNYKNVINH